MWTGCYNVRWSCTPLYDIHQKHHNNLSSCVTHCTTTIASSAPLFLHWQINCTQLAWPCFSVSCTSATVGQWVLTVSMKTVRYRCTRPKYSHEHVQWNCSPRYESMLPRRSSWCMLGLAKTSATHYVWRCKTRMTCTRPRTPYGRRCST